MVKAEAIETMASHIITKEEEHLILQLKENVKDILTQKWLLKSEEDQRLYFVKWIRARDHDLEKATNMLRNHLQWRVETNADEILQTNQHPFFAQNYPFQCVGVDKMGQPVFCVPFSEWDFRKVVNDSERLAESDDFFTHTFESIVKTIETAHENRAVGDPAITQMTVILDTKNFPYGQLVKYSAIKKIVQMASIYEAHYPEILFQANFINCPSYFGLFMSLIKPVIAPKTMSKLRLYTSFTKWQDDISEIIDPTIIPERYGGTLKDDMKDV